MSEIRLLEGIPIEVWYSDGRKLTGVVGEPIDVLESGVVVAVSALGELFSLTEFVAPGETLTVDGEEP